MVLYTQPGTPKRPDKTSSFISQVPCLLGLEYLGQDRLLLAPSLTNLSLATGFASESTPLVLMYTVDIALEIT